MTCLMNASSSSSSWEGARPSGGGAAPRAAHAAPPSKARRNKKEKKSTESSSRRTEERPYSEDQLRQGVLLVLKGLSKGKAAARIGFPSAASTLGRYAAEARKIPLVLAACEANGDDGDDGVLRAHVATITFKERGSPEFNERSMFSTDARGFFVAAIKLFSQLGFPMDAERIRGMMADAVNARLPVDGWRAQVPAEVPARQPERSRVRGCQVVSITVSVRSVTVSRRHVPLQKKDTRRALCQNTETLHGWIITNKSSRSDAWPSTGKRTEGTAPSSAGRLARRFLRHGHRRAGRVSASPSAPVARGEMSAHLSASYRCPVRCS